MKKNIRKEWPFPPDVKSLSSKLLAHFDAILNENRIITN